MEIDRDKIDDVILALLYLTLDQDGRAWTATVPHLFCLAVFMSFPLWVQATASHLGVWWSTSYIWLCAQCAKAMMPPHRAC